MHSGLSMHMYVSHLLIRKPSTFNLINTTSCLRRNTNKICQGPSSNIDFMRICHSESPHSLIHCNLPGKLAVYKINVLLNEGLYNKWQHKHYFSDWEFELNLNQSDHLLRIVSSRSCMLCLILGRCFLLLETNSSVLKTMSLARTPCMIKCKKKFIIMIDLVYMQCMHKTALVWTAEHISQSCEASFIPKQFLHFLYNGESTIGTRKWSFLLLLSPNEVLFQSIPL